MVEDGRYCIDVIRQNQAVIAALEKVNELILGNHLDTCVTRAAKGKNEKEKKKVYQEIIEVSFSGEKMIRKVIIAVILILIGGVGGYLAFRAQAPPGFEELSPSERLQRVTEQRDRAIEMAVEEGVFECCIEPPCTMCYLEANQWNNYQAGTCACDELIAQGKEPCPQCKRGLCETNEEGTCQVNGGEVRDN